MNANEAIDEGLSVGERKSSAGAPAPADAAPPCRRKFAVSLCAFVVLALVAFAAAFLLPGGAQTRDPNAELGQLDGKSPEEVQAELDRIVDEGMFSISIAGRAVFADGASEGELRIENVPANRYLMKVEITRDDTGDRIYASGLIEPNRHIQKARLDVDLDVGTYPCTAVFYAYDPKTEEQRGQAAAKMTIEVAN